VLINIIIIIYQYYYCFIVLLFPICNKHYQRKGKCTDLTCNLKADKISLVYHTNQTNKMKRAKQNKTRQKTR